MFTAALRAPPGAPAPPPAAAAGLLELVLNMRLKLSPNMLLDRSRFAFAASPRARIT